MKDGYDPKNEDERAIVTAYTRAESTYYDRRIENLKRSVPDARIIDLPGAGHFLFLTRQAEVLAALHQFVAAIR